MKNMLKLKFILLLLILMMSSCYTGPTSRVMKTTNENYPATNPANVQIFPSKQPEEPYKEIGTVSADKYNRFAKGRSGDEINLILKEKAASIGGNAIINITEDIGSVSGVVIVFTSE